jgi:hypothetical protein
VAEEKSSLKKFLPFILGIVVFIGTVAGGYFFMLKKGNQSLKAIKLENITYKRIYFDKFVIARNIYPAKDESKASKYLSKVWVFYLKGFVDVEFPLKDFELKGDTLVYKGDFKYKNEEILPYVLTITIPPSDFYEVYEINPRPISPEEAKSIGKVAGLIAAPVGGYLGAKVGGNLAGVLCKFVPKAGKLKAVCGLSREIGSLVGGIAGTGGAYVSVSNYVTRLITGFRFTDEITVEDKEKVLEKAKKLILLDIASNLDLQKELKSAFETYVKSYFRQYGVNIRKIVYKTQ